MSSSCFPRRRASLWIGLAVMTALGSATGAQAQVPAISDAQVCVNPALKDPIVQQMQKAKPTDFDPSKAVGLEKMIVEGHRLKDLENAQLVSRVPTRFVCRYDSIWTGGRPGVADVTAKLIITVTGTATGPTNVDVHLE